ncbi:MAG: hypothetical protein KA160_05835 [Lacibacter sp.]|nr:hypothetical protein [Lacibacter sp.]
MIRREFLIIVCLLMMGVSAMAQVTPVVTASKEKIFIGEPVTLIFELKAISRNADVHWKFPDSIPHFEYVALDTTDLLKRAITITSFDSGLWAVTKVTAIIPSNVNGKEQLVTFPMVEVLVEYDTSGNQMLNDVKPIIEVNAGDAWIGYAVAAAAVTALILLIILFRRWKKKKLSTFIVNSANTALEDFLIATKKLKTEEWDTQLAQKKNFSDLSHAVKHYYERSLQQPYSRLTTDELAMQLKPYLLNETLINTIQVLRLGDAVKFAKFAAHQDECLQTIERMEITIKQSEKELKPDA